MKNRKKREKRKDSINILGLIILIILAIHPAIAMGLVIAFIVTSNVLLVILAFVILLIGLWSCVWQNYLHPDLYDFYMRIMKVNLFDVICMSFFF